MENQKSSPFFASPDFNARPPKTPSDSARKQPPNCRNELFMKSVYSSPYSKAYTQSSDEAYVFRTPIRTASSTHVSGDYQTNTQQCFKYTPVHNKAHPAVHDGSTRLKTPQGMKDSPVTTKYVHFTPQNRAQNPFEKVLMERLHLPTFSPGMFSYASTPSTDEKKPFTWSIDNIAMLHPAKIDENPKQDYAFDLEAEEKAQHAINEFFSNKQIVPSPWTGEEKTKNLLETPSPQTGGQRAVLLNYMNSEFQGSIEKELPKRKKMAEASCQTALSLPPDFDIKKVLGDYMVPDSQEENNVDALSTSSLRRKLFFQGDASATPSPVKGVKDAIHLEPISPYLALKPTQLQWDQETPLKTPGSAQFSSSPIGSGGNPDSGAVFRRRLSLDSDGMGSPELSPIIHGMKPSGSDRVRKSSGCFADDGSFLMSPVAQRSEETSFDDGHKVFTSPDISPIKLDNKTPEQKNDLQLEEEFLTPLCSGNKDTIDLSTPILSSSVISEAKNPDSSERTTMNFDSSSANPRRNLQESFELSAVDMDITNEILILPNMTNQDTGYQTTSLQSTSQETGSHTNLTTQFSALPSRIESIYSDSNIDSDSAFVDKSLSQDSVPMEVALQREFMNDGDSYLSENEVIERARQVLAMANSLYPDLQQQNEMHFHNLTSKFMNQTDNVSSWEPVISSTPQKKEKTKKVSSQDDVSASEAGKQQSYLASEIALAALRKAGDTLAKVEKLNFKPQVKKKLVDHGKSGNSALSSRLTDFQ